MRKVIVISLTAMVCFVTAWSLGCCRSNTDLATELPPEDVVLAEGTPGERGPAPMPSVAGGPAPAAPSQHTPAAGTPEGTDPHKSPNGTQPTPGASDPLPETPVPPRVPKPVVTPIPTAVTYTAQDVGKVKGGRIEFVLPGTVAQIRDAFLDFDNMEGHRSWAKKYRTLSRKGNVTLAEWRFKGRMGIHPTVHIEFTTQEGANETLIRFKLRKKAFGIGTFFGEYRIRPLPGTPARSQVIERTFLDSGISFANASRENLEKGHRGDAEKLRAWMTERLAAKK